MYCLHTTLQYGALYGSLNRRAGDGRASHSLPTLFFCLRVGDAHALATRVCSPACYEQAYGWRGKRHSDGNAWFA